MQPLSVNRALSDGAKDVWLAGPLAELLIEHKVGPVHPLDDSEGVELKAIDTVRDGLAERLGLSTERTVALQTHSFLLL